MSLFFVYWSVFDALYIFFILCLSIGFGMMLFL